LIEYHSTADAEKELCGRLCVCVCFHTVEAERTHSTLWFSPFYVRISFISLFELSKWKYVCACELRLQMQRWSVL